MASAACRVFPVQPAKLERLDLLDPLDLLAQEDLLALLEPQERMA